MPGDKDQFKLPLVLLQNSIQILLGFQLSAQEWVTPSGCLVLVVGPKLLTWIKQSQALSDDCHRWVYTCAHGSGNNKPEMMFPHCIWGSTQGQIPFCFPNRNRQEHPFRSRRDYAQELYKCYIVSSPVAIWIMYLVGWSIHILVWLSWESQLVNFTSFPKRKGKIMSFKDSSGLERQVSTRQHLGPKVSAALVWFKEITERLPGSWK